MAPIGLVELWAGMNPAENLEPIVLTSRTIPFPVPIASEYLDAMVAMARINRAVMSNLCESFRLPAWMAEPDADTPVEVRS